MYITILDYKDGKVIVERISTTNSSDAERWLDKNGYDATNSAWMITNELDLVNKAEEEKELEEAYQEG